MFSDKITYLKNQEKIITDGKTNIIIESKYKIDSKNILFLINERIISSENKTTLRDDSFNVYKLDNFLYLLDKEQIKGNNIIAISNFDLPKSDKYY